MILFPAIDLYGGQAVRLYKGDFDQMTIYDKEPIRTAVKMELEGATHLHLVDLEGAKIGLTPHLEVIRNIVNNSKLFVEVGGGVRSLDTIERYLKAGASRVILGTAAVQNPALVAQAVEEFGGAIAVGVDVKEGMVATHGWTQTSAFSCDDFCKRMQEAGVATIICTDISRDGAMKGTNLELYQNLRQTYDLEIIASGGVSTLEDVRALRDAGIHGAIVGTAYYTGTIQLAEAIRIAGGETP